MIDTTERFLKDIADRIGPELVEEVRLFPPIRQGGTESAVAIVASSSFSCSLKSLEGKPMITSLPEYWLCNF